MKRSDVEQVLAKELPQLLSALKQDIEGGIEREDAIAHLSWAIIETLEKFDLMSPPRRRFWNVDQNGQLQQHHKNGDYVNEWERE